MSRFRSRFEPTRPSSGQEPDSLLRGFNGSPAVPLRRSADRPFGNGEEEWTASAATVSSHGMRLRPSPEEPSVSPANGSRWPGEAVAQGFGLLGLSSREVRMYLAFLHGPRSAREASEIAGLHRATGYRVLLRLLERGLILSDGRSPRRFRAVEPSILFRRLELVYRDETEIPSFLAEALAGESGSRPEGYSPLTAPLVALRILAPEGRATHPAIVELSQARMSVAAIVRPLSTPVSYRNALARTLGHLARDGVRVRLITDAMPADYRFLRTVVREAGGTSSSIQVRHFCPVLSQLYSIDRRTVVRIPTLGASNRALPVGVAIRDRSRVQALVTRFESLWAESTGSLRTLGSGHEPAWASSPGRAPRTAGP